MNEGFPAKKKNIIEVQRKAKQIKGKRKLRLLCKDIFSQKYRAVAIHVLRLFFLSFFLFGALISAFYPLSSDHPSMVAFLIAFDILICLFAFCLTVLFFCAQLFR